MSNIVPSSCQTTVNQLLPVGTVQPEQINTMLFQQCLLNSMDEGVIFIDANQRILVWSQPIEAMTGISFTSVEGKEFSQELLSMSDGLGTPFDSNNSPISKAFRTGTRTRLDCKIIGRSGRQVRVSLTIVPVVAANGLLHGGVILIQDRSLQMDLQRQLKDLYESSTLDPLTQVANRSEFERVLDEYVRTQQTTPDFECSLIICDIDFFKQINDNYNHHIGDQALVSFAQLLQQFVRQEDLVARFGGEEFVILCGNCDVSSAVQRAEEIRLALTRTPQPMLDGKCITASFGVSELKPEDSTTDLFVRADTALLRAKELGRNRVVEASLETQSESLELTEQEKSSIDNVSWRKLSGNLLVTNKFATTTPVSILVEKLRGFIMETEATINRVDADFASLGCEIEDPNDYGRRGRFIVDIEFQDGIGEETKGKTLIRMTIREGKRKWFATNANDLAPQLATRIQQYLMLSKETLQKEIQPHATKSNR